MPVMYARMYSRERGSVLHVMVSVIVSSKLSRKPYMFEATWSLLDLKIFLDMAAKNTFLCDALLLPPSLVLCVLRGCSMCIRKGLILSLASALVPKYPPPLYPKFSIMLLTSTLSRSSCGQLQYVPRT